MCVTVGKCGALWGAVLWIGGGVGEKGNISDCGMGANVGVRTAGCANFHKF